MNQLNSQAHWRFIINPAAGGGRAGRRWSDYSKKLQAAGIRFDAVFTKEKKHAIELAKTAVEEGCRHLVAVGGDGTAHEVINGILQQNACPSQEVIFALLPVGTGNDWIRTHRIPKQFDRWLAVFLQGKTTVQDAGWMAFFHEGREEKRFFLNVAGFAYDGFLAQKAAVQGKGLSWMPSAIAYLWLIFRCLFQFQPPRARVRFDGQTVEQAYYTINVGVCRYSGGGIQLVPHALPADGKLALTLIRGVGKFHVLLATPLFYTGKIGLHPAVRMFQTEEVLIEEIDNQTVLAEADGEFLGEAPVRVGILAGALKVLVP